MMQTSARPCMGQADAAALALPRIGGSMRYEELIGASNGGSAAAGEFDATPDKIEEVQTVDQMVYNSWKGMLARNLGRAVIVSFLVGTRSTVVAAGTLQEVGNDYITLYHPERGSYLTADLYSIKFVEFPQSGG